MITFVIRELEEIASPIPDMILHMSIDTCSPAMLCFSSFFAAPRIEISRGNQNGT